MNPPFAALREELGVGDDAEGDLALFRHMAETDHSVVPSREEQEQMMERMRSQANGSEEVDLATGDVLR